MHNLNQGVGFSTELGEL